MVVESSWPPFSKGLNTPPPRKEEALNCLVALNNDIKRAAFCSVLFMRRSLDRRRRRLRRRRRRRRRPRPRRRSWRGASASSSSSCGGACGGGASLPMSESWSRG